MPLFSNREVIFLRSLSNAEQALDGPTSGDMTTTWADKPETIPTAEIESNRVENLVRGRKKRRVMSQWGAPFTSSSSARRTIRIFKLYGKNPDKAKTLRERSSEEVQRKVGVMIDLLYNIPK
ncbi:MAG: hypothetical protein KDE33_27900 [Bacteroidetes bacterium]|nr:hypothetical protein [Bacteroidota bacterium]MCB0836739.1 hypothetical protein [Bacteroidota bacterium]